MPTIYIIAGPNGAGKMTAAKTIFPEILKIIEFVNADEIARGLSPFNPEGVGFAAGRVMLNRISQLAKERKNFAFERTLATKSYYKLIEQFKATGYFVVLIFLWLNNVQVAKLRVLKRVSEGGHNIPDEIIERRFKRGVTNLKAFMNLVDNWYLYDNSFGIYELIAKEVNEERIILNFDSWQKILLKKKIFQISCKRAFKK